jgi:hypothetical protein
VRSRTHQPVPYVDSKSFLSFTYLMMSGYMGSTFFICQVAILYRIQRQKKTIRFALSADIRLRDCPSPHQYACADRLGGMDASRKYSSMLRARADWVPVIRIQPPCVGRG